MDAEPVIDVSHACPRWRRALPDVDRVVVRAAAAAADCAVPRGPVEISIALGDDALLHRLNRAYRDQDKPTNVLAFPATDDPGGQVTPVPLGDVVVSFDTAAAEAAAAGKSLSDHVSHLVVHGVLHLLGYDHESEEEAAAMEGLETTLLDRLGVADPHGDGTTRHRAVG